MIIKQISIFVENKHGRMAEITKTLAKNNVDIRAMSIADTADYGIFRLIVDKPETAILALKEEHLTVALTDVIAISIPDEPGALSKAVVTLSDGYIDIEYMYASLNAKDNSAFVILRVEDNDKAILLLKNAGITIMNGEDLYNI